MLNTKAGVDFRRIFVDSGEQLSFDILFNLAA